MFNVSSSEEGTGSIIPDIDNSLVSWWRMDDVNQTGLGAKVYDSSGHCYDNKTEILTENGWKLFAELDQTEKVATLNQESMELEWQMPMEYQEFENNKEMYKVILEDGTDLLVSEKHKVYAGVENLYPRDFKYSTSSFVENILTSSCCLKCGSLDQIGILLSDKDRAKYSVSSLSDIKEFALTRNFSNLNFEIELIFDLILPNSSSISSKESPDNSCSRSLCSSISSNRCSGANNSIWDKKIISLVTPLPITPVNTMPASITNSIYDSPRYNCLYLLCSDLFTSLPSSNASLSVNLDLDTILLNCSNSSISLACLSASSLASSDQFTQGSFSIINLKSSEMFNATLAIYNSPLCLISSNLISCSARFFNLDFNTSGQLTSGIESIFFFISSGIDNVSVGILAPPIYKQYTVDTQKDVSVYKSFDFEDSKLEVSDFNLMPIIDVYSDVNDGKDVYFLNALNEPVKVLRISKEPYNGRIYDVDVENDVVLVRRKSDEKDDKKAASFSERKVTSFSRKAGDEFFKENEGNLALQGPGRGNSDENEAGIYDTIDGRLIDGKLGEEVDLRGAVWSGNSNNGTAYGNAVQTDAGKLGKGFEFDGDGDYVGVNNFNNSQKLSVFCWVAFDEAADGWLINKRDNANDMQWQLYYYEGKLDAVVFNGTDSAGTALYTFTPNISQWYHVGFTTDGTNGSVLRLYLNGNEKDNDTLTDDMKTGLRELVIGVTAWDKITPNLHFNGTIDDVMIFNRSLSADEILSLYNATKLQHTETLNEGSHTFKAYTQDLAGNMNDSGVISFTTDTIAPSFSSNQTNASSTTPKINDILQINITVVDDTDVSMIILSHNQSGVLKNASNQTFTGTETSVTAIFNLSITMAKGLMQWQIWANDSAGNSNISQQFTVQIQNTAPIVPNLTAPPNNSNFNTSSITFNFSSSDADSDTITYYFFVNSVYNDSTTDDNITKVFSDGKYNWSVIAGDLTENSSSNVYYFLVDTVYPNISFVTPPTPANGTSQTDTYIFVNVSSADTNNISTFIDFDNSLVGWWRMDDVNQTGEGAKVYDISGHCYDNKTEILTENGWKYFYDLNKTEKVATLNQEKHELEWQLPTEWQEFENNKEMYRINLEDGSELLVSEKHRVYGGIEKNINLDTSLDKNKEKNEFAELANAFTPKPFNADKRSEYINVSISKLLHF